MPGLDIEDRQAAFGRQQNKRTNRSATRPSSTRKQEKARHGDHNAAHQDQVRASYVPRSRRDSHPLLHAHCHRFIAVMSRIVRCSPTTSRKEVNSPSARDLSPAQKVLGGK